jgi:hypothetical protein
MRRKLWLMFTGWEILSRQLGIKRIQERLPKFQLYIYIYNHEYMSYNIWVYIIGEVIIGIRVLVWVPEWKRDFNKFLTCTRMVHTRKGAMTWKGFEERQREDLLEDIASHMPLESHQSRLGESIGLNHDTDVRRTEGLQPEGLDQ